MEFKSKFMVTSQGNPQNGHVNLNVKVCLNFEHRQQPNLDLPASTQCLDSKAQTEKAYFDLRG